MRVRNRTAWVIGLIALIVGLVAGLLTWFQLQDAGYALPAAYNAAYVYAAQGGSALSALNSLGNLLATDASSNALVVVLFALVLFFWPAMLVAGLVNEAGRAIRWQPALWGIIAFITAYVMMYEANDSIGLGVWLDLLAVILIIHAYLTATKQKMQPEPPPTPPAPAPASPPPQGAPPSQGGS